MIARPGGTPDIPLTALAPAKVNLSLRITGRRADGYHLLDSIVAFTDFGDRIDVIPDNGLSLSVTGPFAAAIPDDRHNLVLKAARLLSEMTGIAAGARITLTKNLPAAGGIGGGSSDAAAVLRLLCQLWSLKPTTVQLHAVALALGADVPVCLSGRAARMTGIGDILEDLPPLPQIGILLVNPGHPCETPAVFRARTGPFSQKARELGTIANTADLISALREEPNELTEAAITVCPAIRSVLDALATAPGVRLTRMSGSGATCFGLFDDPSAAHNACTGIQHPRWWSAAGALRP